METHKRFLSNNIEIRLITVFFFKFNNEINRMEDYFKWLKKD